MGFPEEMEMCSLFRASSTFSREKRKKQNSTVSLMFIRTACQRRDLVAPGPPDHFPGEEADIQKVGITPTYSCQSWLLETQGQL
jgi:hypothetical protein